jgi:hypothetical protein
MISIGVAYGLGKPSPPSAIHGEEISRRKWQTTSVCLRKVNEAFGPTWYDANGGKATGIG